MIGDSYTSKYTAANVPGKKIDYSYSEYGGEAFFASYVNSRMPIMQRSVEEINDISFGNTNTEGIFKKWFYSLLNKDAVNYGDLDLLLKRFEVTKKIYDDYDIDFRPQKAKNYETYRLYGIFALILSMAYGLTKKLQYLNGLIKLNDINYELYKKVDLEFKDIIALVYRKEIEYIRELRKQL